MCWLDHLLHLFSIFINFKGWNTSYVLSFCYCNTLLRIHLQLKFKENQKNMAIMLASTKKTLICVP